jgi:hypothetical protein
MNAKLVYRAKDMPWRLFNVVNNADARVVQPCTAHSRAFDRGLDYRGEIVKTELGLWQLFLSGLEYCTPRWEVVGWVYMGTRCCCEKAWGD